LEHEKERCAQVEPIQPREVEVTAVHDVEGTGFGREQVQCLDIVELAVGDVNKGWNIAA
jgi:hypothetical protein